MSDIKELAAAVLADEEAFVKRFSRSEYTGAFEDFMNRHADFYREAGILLSEESVPEAERFEDLSGQLIEAADGVMKDVARRDQLHAQNDLNLFMVCFVIPGFLEYGDRVEKLRNKDAMTALCKKWGGHFRDSRIQPASMEEIDSGFRRKLCYITTAACLALGRDAGSEELTVLKNFRDGWIQKTESGRALVHSYYDVAPTVVKRIAKEADPKSVYTDLWNRYIKTCVDLIHTGRNDEAVSCYGNMVKELSRRYLYTSAKINS